MTINGVFPAAAFVIVALVCIGMALLGSWRDEMKRIRQAHQPITPPIDYERLHYGPALKAFLDKQGAN